MEILEYYVHFSLKEKKINESNINNNRLLAFAYNLESDIFNDIDTNLDKLNHSKKALNLLSIIFEYLGNTTKKNSPKTFEFFLHSAICYSLSEFEACSVSILNKILETSDKVLLNCNIDEVDEFHDTILILILRMIARKFKSISLFLERNHDYLKNKNKFITSKKKEGYFFILNFLKNICEFYIKGNFISLKNSHNSLDDAINIFLELDDSFFIWLLTKIKILNIQISKRSIWTQLNIFKSGKKKKFLDNLIQNEYYELWNSQITAINNGLIHNFKRNLVISMPTSSGKTRIAEIAIINTLTKEDICFYIVPTIALIRQVENDLKENLESIDFKIFSFTGQYEYIPIFEEQILKIFNIFIITPEKLDLLLRKQSDIIKKSKLYIFDESHNIEDNERGLRLEFLISKIIKRTLEFTDVRTILMSAVLPESNLAQIVKWLREENSEKLFLKWKPTRLLEGVLYSTTNSQRYHLNYLNLFRIMDILPVERTKYKRAANLALKYLRNFNPILIYCTRKESASNCIKYLNEEIINNNLESMFVENEYIQKELNDFSYYIRQSMGDTYPLAGYIENGISFHHANLPLDIKLRIEILLKKGYIKIIAATSTITEGMNFPVRTVIFSGFHFYSKLSGKSELLNYRDFINIAGRAGRACRDTEGHVILIDPIGGKYKQYIGKENIEPIESRLILLHKIIIGEISKKQRLKETKLYHQIQSELLFQISNSENLTDLNYFIEDFLNDTLFLNQIEENSDELKNVTNFHIKQTKKIVEKKKNDDLIRLYSESGFSFSSCEDINTKIRKLIEIQDFKKVFFQEKLEINKQIIEMLVEVAVLPFEISSELKLDIQLITDILFDWINYNSILEISDKYFNGEILNCSNFIHSAFNRLLPWGISLVIRLIDYNINRIPEAHYKYEFYLLPAFIKYGVNTIFAVFFRILGFDRMKSRDLANFIEKNLEKENELNWIKKFQFLILYKKKLLELLKNEEILDNKKYQLIEMILNTMFEKMR